MLDTVLAWITLLPLDATPALPTGPQQPVSPTRSGNGFAAGILGGFFGLGLLVLAMILITLRPKRADPRDVSPPRPRPR